jgi:hypothetical protein
MRTHYTCSKCKKLLEATEQYFFSSTLKLADKAPNRTSISNCKSCSHQRTIEKRHPRVIRIPHREKNITGTVYIIGSDIAGTPYKIGITSGKNIDQRKSALQTSHWIELKLVWKSDVLKQVNHIERALHKYFESCWVRGEWFNISRKDIKDMPKIIEQLQYNMRQNDESTVYPAGSN